MSGKVCRRKVRQPASSQGRIRITGMHGYESKAGARVLGPYSLSREASKGDGHHWQHNLWNVHRGEEGGLGTCDLRRGPETPDQSG